MPSTRLRGRIVRERRTATRAGFGGAGGRRPSDAAVDFVALHMVGPSPRFQAALALLRRIALCDATVLIQGETGTGKELAARAIHYLGARRNAPFIPVNCGAIPDSLIESEFFGHVRGAFTDAKEARVGVVAQAQGGTLFLDELEVLSTRGQVALLRFLQDQQYRPVGGASLCEADVRIIGASNADLQSMAASGAYRADLLFRLSVLLLELPPLRERPGDAVVLAERFVQRLSIQYGSSARRLAPSARAQLARREWPGNVRELENLIHRSFLLSDGPEIDLADEGELAPCAAHAGPVAPERRTFRQAKALAIAEFERSYLSDLLRSTRGNISLAARLSGKERSRFSKLVKKHGLERISFSGGPSSD